ncbi:MAG: transglycosylase SLT domain-containing protein [Acidobacteriota bacterium]
MLKFVLLLTLLPLPDTLDRVEEARRQGRYREAITLLEQVRRESPDVYRLNHLLYLQSVLQKQAGLKEQARQGFDTILESDFPLPDATLLHLIDVTASIDLDERRKYFESFLERYPAHARWSAVALQYADALAKDHRDTQATRWYERLIANGRMYVRTSRLRVAELLLKGPDVGRTDVKRRREAAGILAKLLVEDDHDSIALEAARHLRKIEQITRLSEIELRHRARAFISNREGASARVYLNRLINRYPKSASRPEYGYLLGRSFYLDGRKRDAIAVYDRTYRRFPTSEWGVYSRYLSGNLSLGLNDYQQAILAFREVVEKHSGSEYFDRALLGLADALIWQGDRPGAEGALTKGLAKPGSRAHSFHYQLARLRIEEGRYQEALTNLGQICALTSQQLPSGVTREEVLFWKGFCEQQMGLAAESQQSYLAGASGRANYFGYLARERAGSQNSAPLTDSPRAWSGRLLGPRAARSPAVEASALDVGAQIQSVRLRELLFLRLFDEAYAELKRQGPGPVVKDKGNYLFHLASWAQRGELFRQSLDAAEELTDLLYSGVPPEQYPPELQRLLYPLPYWDLVVRFGTERGIDPYLLLAVMKQESGFQPDAISPASARGLMQLMPGTARELSRRLRVPFKGTATLDDPEVSINLGSFYFRQMLDNFGGVLEKGLAAYNGGASNVRRWEKKLTTPDTTIFVSNIGFRETKLYVLRVLGSYWTYRRLYANAERQSGTIVCARPSGSPEGHPSERRLIPHQIGQLPVKKSRPAEIGARREDPFFIIKHLRETHERLTN